MTVSHLTRAAVAVVAAGALALTGCSDKKPAPASSGPTLPPTAASSAAEQPSASPSVPTKVSDTLDDLSVTGKYGEKPAVAFQAPWGISETKVKELQPAPDGAKTVGDGDTVTVNYYGVDGRTGQTFDESFSKGQPATFPLSGVIAGFKKGIVGQHVGSRVLVAMTGPDGYDGQGGQASAGINVGDTLIFVIDILGVQLKQPEGDEQPQDPALPQVSTGTGKPTITIPQGYQAPADVVSKDIIVGKGDKVTAKDVLTVNYQAVSLKTGQVVEQTYDAESQQGALSGLISCWQKGLIDKTVGSRVLLVCPAATAYPDGNATPKVDAGDTLIYVVDVLGRQAGQ